MESSYVPSYWDNKNRDDGIEIILIPRFHALYITIFIIKFVQLNLMKSIYKYNFSSIFITWQYFITGFLNGECLTIEWVVTNPNVIRPIQYMLYIPNYYLQLPAGGEDFQQVVCFI